MAKVLIFIRGIIPFLVEGRTHKVFLSFARPMPQDFCEFTHYMCAIERMHYFIHSCLSTHKLIHSNYYIFEIIIIQVFHVKRQTEKKTHRNAHTYTGKNHGKIVKKICIFPKIVRKKLYFEENLYFFSRLSHDFPSVHV